MDNTSFREILFENAVIGSLVTTNCDGKLHLCKNREMFGIDFKTHSDEHIKVAFKLDEVKRVYTTFETQKMYIDILLKPLAVKRLGEYLEPKEYTFQLSQNTDYRKFQLYFKDLIQEDISFMENFFSSVDVIDESLSNVETKLAEPNKNIIFKSLKKKIISSDDKDKSDDYVPIKRQRRQIFSAITLEEILPKRSVRTRKREDVNLCEDLSEEAQLQEALKRSLKGVDQNIIDRVNLIESKSGENKEPEQLFDNIDKSIELFSYDTTCKNIIVRMEDYICLSRSEYLSDVIIDFYLHFIYNNKMTQEQRDKTFIFGTHFYTLYATSSEFSGWNNDENAGLNAKAKRYLRIEGFLSADVNIFEKDFIVFPLMDSNHWFLAIVCFPKLNGSYTLDGNIKVDAEDIKRHPKKHQPPLKSSCILIFDSIKGNGSRRTVAINHIKNFLEYEWLKKYQDEFHFDVKTISGHSPKVPLQLNNVDCGCFILEFFERFFVTSEIIDYRMPIELSNWFSPQDVRKNKRREIATVIQLMMENSNIELPNIRFYEESHKSKDLKIVETIEILDSQEDPLCDNENEMSGYINGNEDAENVNMNNNNSENNNYEAFNNNNDFNCLDSNKLELLINQDDPKTLLRDDDNSEEIIKEIIKIIPNVSEISKDSNKEDEEVIKTENLYQLDRDLFYIEQIEENVNKTDGIIDPFEEVLMEVENETENEGKESSNVEMSNIEQPQMIDENSISPSISSSAVLAE